MTDNLKLFEDSVNFHRNRFGGMGKLVLSVAAAEVLLKDIDSMKEEIARLLNDKGILKSALVTAEQDLINKEDILEAKEQELEDLREKFDLLSEEPPLKPLWEDPQSWVQHGSTGIEQRLDNLNWRLVKLEHGIGGKIEHLTREGA